MATRYDSAIIGLGATGASCLKYLASRGERLLVTDSRANPPNLEILDKLDTNQVTACLGGFDATALKQAKRLVFSPGVDRHQPPFNSPEVKGLPVTGDIQIFAEARAELSHPGKLIAVTGSNAKSTVTDLISQLLDGHVAVGGNFGRPALDLLQETEVDYWVLEVSSFQLALVHKLASNVALLLNVSADHLDRHGSIERYAACKQRVFSAAKTCVWNRADDLSKPSLTNIASRVSVGIDRPPTQSDFGLITTPAGRCLNKGDWAFEVNQLGRFGVHRETNALFALAAVHLSGCSLSACESVLRSYSGLPHRLTSLGIVGEVSFVDDSKATNVSAACAAIKCLAKSGQRNLLLLAGGQLKTNDFESLANVAQGRVRHAAFFGQAADALKRAFCTITDISKLVVEDMAAAFHELMALAQPDDIMLLSPACSSLDQFSGFAARGEAFSELVRCWSQDRVHKR